MNHVKLGVLTTLSFYIFREHAVTTVMCLCVSSSFLCQSCSTNFYVIFENLLVLIFTYCTSVNASSSLSFYAEKNELECDWEHY